MLSPSFKWDKTGKSEPHKDKKKSGLTRGTSCIHCKPRRSVTTETHTQGLGSGHYPGQLHLHLAAFTQIMSYLWNHLPLFRESFVISSGVRKEKSVEKSDS